MESNEKHMVKVKRRLLSHGSITSWFAILEQGNTRLSQYILLLRKEGWDIDMKRIRTGNKTWYGLYTLKKATLKESI